MSTGRCDTCKSYLTVMTAEDAMIEKHCLPCLLKESDKLMKEVVELRKALDAFDPTHPLLRKVR